METSQEPGLIQQHFHEQQVDGSAPININTRDITANSINQNASTAHQPGETSHSESVPEIEYVNIQGNIPSATTTGNENRRVEMADHSQESEQIEENIVNMAAPLAPILPPSASSGNEHVIAEMTEDFQVSEQMEDLDETSQAYDNIIESEHETDVESLTSSSSSSLGNVPVGRRARLAAIFLSSDDDTNSDSSIWGLIQYEDSEDEESANLSEDSEDYDSTDEISEEWNYSLVGDLANMSIIIGDSSSATNTNPVPRERNRRVSAYSQHRENRRDVNDTLEPNVTAESCITYDTNLPTEHLYLGSNMTRVIGVNYFEPGQECMITLFLHGHLLFPGEVLPFVISRKILESCCDSQNGIIIGICFDGLGKDVYYGVTCQIFQKGPRKIGTPEDNFDFVLSCARQRFVVKKNQITGPLKLINTRPEALCKGLIKIQREHYLPEPLPCPNMGSVNRFRGNDYMKQMYRRFQAAGTPWPAYTYNDYEMADFIERARKYLAEHNIDTMPAEPISISFWLGRNLNLSKEVMQNILKMNSVNERFKTMTAAFNELNDQRYDAVFLCEHCTFGIAKFRHLFAMSKYGAQTQYCDPDGMIYEINTFSALMPHSIRSNRVESMVSSWFPNYVYKDMLCKSCFYHIGWKYRSIHPNMTPRQFFALSSASVKRDIVLSY